MNIQAKSKKPGNISLMLMCFLLVVLLAVNIGGGIFFNVITQFFSKANINEVKVVETKAAAENLVERMAGEGTVLLKNDKGTLPLNMGSERETKVNLFGWAAVSPMISGGIGSGSGNTSETLDFIGGLQNNGFTLNQELIDFYNGLGYSRGNVNSYGYFDADYTKIEAPIDGYSDELLNNARDFSDVAVVIFSRLGNEAEDLPVDMSELSGRSDEHYLELGGNEEALLDKIASMNFEKVIVIINAGFPFEMGFLDEKNIDAALWIGGPGQTGMNSVAKILKGEINPSGRTVDTYPYDLTSAPSYQNFGEFFYSGESYVGEGYYGPETRNYNYVDYAEGIYVGYRYYETRYIDNATGQCDEEAYRKVVQYPFGYGLSYSNFKQEITDFTSDDRKAAMTVMVTNTGNTAGKEVVQLYLTAPYIEGGIEKSHVSLIGFAKTGILEPGAAEEMEISFAIEDLASFDYINNGCYVLDEGNYIIKLMSNAHHLIDSREIVISQTIVYGDTNKRESDQEAAVQHFKDAQGDVTFVSRADWEGTLPGDIPKERKASDELLTKLKSNAPDESTINRDVEDIVVKNNGLKLEDMMGLEYDDPKWELLLEQLSVKDMKKLIGLGGYATQTVKSVEKPYTIDLDGPTGILALVNERAYNGVLYSTAVVIASTWNVDLSREMGEVFGSEATAWGISGIYGPTMNIHRSPFAGRNYEYYSEDGFLSGKIASGIVSGFRSNNVYNYIKHFAAYEQTAFSMGLSTWTNEQALREIYLRPFEICVKEGGAYAVMSSYNRIGSTWTGGSYALLTKVLRGEWGFDGMVITDWFTAPMNADQGIHAGNDLMLATTTGEGNVPADMSNAGKQAMRRACHNILYTVANSVAMQYNDFGPFPYWLVILGIVDALAVAAAVVFFIRRKNRNSIL